MKEAFLQLMRPMPTSILRSSGIDLHDDRSVAEQVSSGLRIAGWFLACLGIIILAAVGLQNVHHNKCIFGLVELSAAIFVMLATTHRWVRLVPALPFWRGLRGPAFLVVALLAGKNPQPPYERISRIATGEAVFGIIFAIALTWRFVRRSPAMTTLIDRFAYTFFVVALLNQMFLPYFFPPLWIVLGFAALLVAWLAYRSEKWKHPHKHHHAARTSGSAAEGVQGIRGT